MSPADPRIVVKAIGGGLAVVGEIDAHTGPVLSARLNELPADADVRLDFSGTTFMDSSGLRILITTHRALSESGRRLLIMSPSSAVRRVIDASGLSAHLNVVPSRT